MKQSKLIYPLNLQLFGEDPKPEDPKPEDNKKDPLEDLSAEQVIEISKKYAKKEELDAEKQKTAQLMSYILEGGELPDTVGGQGEKNPSIEEMRKELYHSDKPQRNLDIVDKTLKLREAVMKEGKEDPFLPSGHMPNGQVVVVQQSDRDAANRVAEVLGKAVKDANGNPDVFDTMLVQIIR